MASEEVLTDNGKQFADRFGKRHLVRGYNGDRPHQALNMRYLTDRFAPSQLLPLRLPATLQPAAAPEASAGAASTAA